MQINTHDLDDLLTTGAQIHTINDHLAGGHHTITYKALTCKYQRDSSSRAGSSRSVCAVTALNCIRLAFQLEARERVEETALRSFFSEEMMDQVMGIANNLFFDNPLEIDDYLEVPIFKETIISTARERPHSLETFKDLFIRLFSPQSMKHITAVVFTQTTEHIVCFRFQSSTSNVFVIFDAHSRSERPFGPAFILANDIDVIANHVSQLLTQPSISKSTTKQDVTANYPITALVVESRDRPSAIDEQDLLAKSVAFLFEKLITVDHAPSNLDLDTLAFGLEQLQGQETQSHVPHKQDNNRQTSHSETLNRRSEFGWQLDLHVSGTVDPKNNDSAEYPKKTESDTSGTEGVKETPDVFMSRSNAGNNTYNSATLDLPKTSDSDLPIRPDGKDFDIVSNAEEDHTHPHLRKRTGSTGEFGWQLNLHAVDPKNNDSAEYPKKTESDISGSEEVKETPDVEDTVSDDDRRKHATYQFTNYEHVFMSGWNAGTRNNTYNSATLDLPKTRDSDLPIRPDGEDFVVSNAEGDHTHPHLCKRPEFGWQLELQQTSIMDRRRKLEDLEIVASILSQAHRVSGGKKKEASDDFLATQTLKGSVSPWEDFLMKQLQEEEELLASSAGYLSQDRAWILSLRKRRIAEEDIVNNAVASSSSTSYTQLGQKERSSTFLHEFDFKPFSSTEGESSTRHRHPRHSPLFPSYLDALQSSNRTFTALELSTSDFSAESHECGVCNELHGEAQIIRLPTCRHTFCRECLRTFTKTRINEGRYPIFCPVCAIERTRVNHSLITQEIVEKLDLSDRDLEKLYSLQLVAHSVILHCPKCKQTMNVDRGEYESQQIIMCPLPACHHSWCKECLKPLTSFHKEHNCNQHGFERLMRKKGWKYCPGCKTPDQKETGCNHMTCGSPGCNVHFCYRCGISIIDTSNGGDVGSAVTDHYINCVMFEKRPKCIIQ